MKFYEVKSVLRIMTNEPYYDSATGPPSIPRILFLVGMIDYCCYFRCTNIIQLFFNIATNKKWQETK